MNGVTGIHHVSAIAGDLQTNLKFYRKILGLRLIKTTINFDDPSQYHLYYSSAVGAPGTLLTFFIWGADGRKGRSGSGQANGIAFAIPANSGDKWIAHLSKNDIPFEGPVTRFGEQVLSFEDPDGLKLQLIASDDERLSWADSHLRSEMAITGLHSISLVMKDRSRSRKLLEALLYFKVSAEERNRTRYELRESKPGTWVDIVEEPEQISGSSGLGTVHHIAFRAETDRHQLDLRKPLMRSGARVTPILDRYYFNAMYFREPNQILFEIATDPPGFTIDESEESLGTFLCLPPWMEKERAEITARLQPLK
ncbi:MAG: VOC family protein [Calditrichia bacterium]